MKPIRILFLFSIVATLLLSGCFLKSVHPLVTTNSAIVVDELEGVWETEDQRWTFIRNPRQTPELAVSGSNFIGQIALETDSSSTVFEDENLYLIIFENKQDLKADTTLFIGYIGEFAGNTFLDLSLLEPNLGENSFKSSHLFGVHTFSRISVKENLVSLYFFKESWVRKLIMGNRIRIKHERISNSVTDSSDDILITASTKELQEFIIKYGHDSEPFDDPIGLKRVTNDL